MQDKSDHDGAIDNVSSSAQKHAGADASNPKEDDELNSQAFGKSPREDE